MTYYDDVVVFHKMFREPSYLPHKLDGEEWSRRIRLMLEELAEVAEAHALGDLEEFADGLIDLVWVVMGTAVEAGLPFDELWEEVKKSNMAKFVNGIPLTDGNGKVTKPEGWRPPDIKTVLDKYRWAGIPKEKRAELKRDELYPTDGRGNPF